MSDEQQKMQSKLSALFLVQFFGLVISFILILIGRSCYQYPVNTFGPYELCGKTIGPISLDGPYSILLSAMFFTSGIFLLTKTGISGFINFFRWLWNKIRSLGSDPGAFVPLKLKDQRWHCELRSVTFVLAFADMVGTAFCIKVTGGAEGSIFTPFLLIIPTIIVLIDIFKASRILAWGCFCLVMFALSIEKSPGFSNLNMQTHHYLLTSSTALCIFFPFLYLKSSRRNRVCPNCSGTGIIPEAEQ